MVGTEDIPSIMGNPSPQPSPNNLVHSRLYKEVSDYKDSEVCMGCTLGP